MNCGCADTYLGPPLTNTCGGGTFILFMGLLDTFLRKKCDISEMCERVTPRLAPDLEYDFVVVGGGSGGAAAAGKLAQAKGWKVLLIEAGGDEPPGSQVNIFTVTGLYLQINKCNFNLNYTCKTKLKYVKLKKIQTGNEKKARKVTKSL